MKWIRPVAGGAALVGAALLVAALQASAQDACPCPKAPAPGWDGSVGVGLALSSGNSDTSSYNASASVIYDPLKSNVFKASGLYLRADSDGETTVDRSALLARDEYKLRSRAFVFGELAFQHDRFKDLDSLFAPALGVGYKVVKHEAVVLDVDAGFALAIEKLRGQDGTAKAALRAGQSFTWKLSGTATFTEVFGALWKLQDFSDAYYHIEGNLTAAVAKRLELKLAYINEIKNRPATPALRKRDSTLVVAIVYKLRAS